MQDCTDGDFSDALPTLRRREITAALHACLPHLLPFLVTALQSHYSALSREGCPQQGDEVSSLPAIKTDPFTHTTLLCFVKLPGCCAGVVTEQPAQLFLRAAWLAAPAPRFPAWGK